LTTKLLYDGADVVLDKASDGTTVGYLNGFGIDDKLSQTSSATGTLYFLQDKQRSTVALMNAAGGLVEHPQYEAFGETSGSPFTRYGYTGRERDSTTGLMYYRARWYDPQQGRFISEDPLGVSGGLNLYEYVTGNPISKTDPTGLLDSSQQAFIAAFVARIASLGAVVIVGAVYASSVPIWIVIGGTVIATFILTTQDANAAENNPASPQFPQFSQPGPSQPVPRPSVLPSRCIEFPRSCGIELAPPPKKKCIFPFRNYQGGGGVRG
jgi:RHS repeat-associated protein